MPRFSEELSEEDLSATGGERAESSVERRFVADVGLRLGLSEVRTLRLVLIDGVFLLCCGVLLSTSCSAGSDEPRDAERARSCLLGALVGPSYAAGPGTNSAPVKDLRLTSLRATERSGTLGLLSGEGVLLYVSEVGVKSRGGTST